MCLQQARQGTLLPFVHMSLVCCVVLASAGGHLQCVQGVHGIAARALSCRRLRQSCVVAAAEMRQKMGLSEEAAGRIIKGVQNQRLIGNLQAVKASGALTLDKVLLMRACAACVADRPLV